MRVKPIWCSYRSLFFMLIATLVASLGGMVLAQTARSSDPEHPIDPDVVRRIVSFNFGALAGQTQDKAQSVDTREVMEPRLTALLTMGDLGDSSIGTVVASMQQPFQSWVQGLAKSAVPASGATKTP